ncbi:MAG: ABC transporter ATP-binding protein [Polyangiaceae bacterium]|nr:ABC transporter ATP-binding protein [Polyangiaceae bacterium]
MPAYELQAVSRTFGVGDAARRALDAVSLTIEAGEVTAITGPSGSGKSTLLAILGALDAGYVGRVSLQGVDLASLDERARARLRAQKIGFVFQSFHLLAHLSVRDNVSVPALFARSAGDPASRAEEVLARVGLPGRSRDRPDALSGGQRQRVAIARALFASPEILLCDEPTGNLDRASSAEIVALLVREARERGRAVVVVTHDPEVSSRADREVSLRDGALVEAA